MAHLVALYEPVVGDGGRQELERRHAAGNDQQVREILDRYEMRREQLSEFMKSFKQRITRYMSKQFKRRGTFWEGHYKSVFVEGSELALLTVAAYIDFNPERAGLVTRPEDYRWSGYSEAISGARSAKLARAEVEAVIEQKGAMTVPEVLRCRVTYFPMVLFWDQRVLSRGFFQGSRRMAGPTRGARADRGECEARNGVSCGFIVIFSEM